MNILFIGNSYTYYNDMPLIFQTLAKENGKDVNVDKITVGGRKLYENLVLDDQKHLEITTLLNSKNYDVLFLQEQSFLPLTDYQAFKKGVEGLINLVKPKRTILYSTWGRKPGNSILDQYGWTNEQMTYDLENAYQTLAKEFGAKVSSVGLCYYYVLNNHPNAELYNEDKSHPSRLGSCLVAIKHYLTTFGALPQSTSTLNLNKEDMCVLLDAVEKTCNQT